MDKDKTFLYCDRAILTCLCLAFFCLPFAKAAVESFVWTAIFIFIAKRFLGYRAQSVWGLLPKTRLNLALGIFTAFNALSVAYSAYLRLSLRGFFGKELKFLAIYFMINEVINSKRRLKVILFAIIASALFIIIDGLSMYFLGVDFLRGHRLGPEPFCASFYCSTDFAAWLIIIIPVFIGIIAANIIPDKRFKIILSASVIIQSLFLIKTYSRGGWFGFLMGISLFIYYALKNSSLLIKKVFVISVMSLLFTGLLMPRSIVTNIKYYIWSNFPVGRSINARLKSIPQVSDGTSASIRINLWKEALRITRDYPLRGCGLNTYSMVAKRYKSFEGGGVYPHNSYFQKAAEIGVFGLLAFLFVLFNFFWLGLRYFNKSRDYLVLGFLSGILAFLVHAFFDTHFYSLPLIVLFWYMLGLTIAITRINQKLCK